jgi:hypothetical protein
MPPKVSRPVSLKALAEARKAVPAQFAAGAAGGGDARTVLAGFVRIHLEYLAAHQAPAAMFYENAALPSGARALREYRKLMLFLLAEFEKCFAAGKDAKKVRADVDPAMAAVHCLGAIQMAWTYWTMGGRKGDLAAAGLNLFDQLWEGIRT